MRLQSCKPPIAGRNIKPVPNPIADGFGDALNLFQHHGARETTVHIKALMQYRAFPFPNAAFKLEFTDIPIRPTADDIEHRTVSA